MRATGAIRVALAATVSAVLLALMMRGIPWADLGASIAGASRPALAVYAVTSLAGLWLRALRFRMLLPPPRPGAGAVLLVTAVQNSLTDLVPGRIASLGSYVYLLVRRHAVALESATATFLVAFVLDFVTLGPLLALAALIRLDAGAWPLAAKLPPGWTILIGAGFTAATVAVLFELTPITRALGRVVRGAAPNPVGAGPGRRLRLAARLDALSHAMAEVRRSGTLLPVLGVSLASRILKYVSLLALMRGLLAGAGHTGPQPDFWDLVLGITATELLSSLPIPALGQFGVWEGGLTGALVLLGFERGMATIVSIGMHAVSQAFEYLVGLAALGVLLAVNNRGKASAGS